MTETGNELIAMALEDRCPSPKPHPLAHRVSLTPAVLFFAWRRTGFSSQTSCDALGDLFNRHCKYFFHRKAAAAAGDGIKLATAVRPDRIGNPAIRHQPFIIPLLIAVIDPLTGENAVAVMLVRTRCRDAKVRREP